MRFGAHTPRRATRRLGVTVVLGVGLSLIVLAAPAGSAVAGRNGRISFELLTGSDSPPQVATIDRYGHDLQKLTDFRTGAGGPDWSPRGGRIVFERLYDDRPGALFTVRADGKRLKRLSSGCGGQCLEDTEAAYSPDGESIVFSRVHGPVVDDNASEIDLMVMHRNGTDVRTLKRFDRLTKGGLEPHGAEWSPDGTQLALLLLDTSSPRNKSAIFTLDVATANLDQVTPFRMNAGNPDWSPGGGRIVFNSNYEGQAAANLYTVHPDGSVLTKLTHNRRRSAFEPTWSPSGKRIAFVAASRHVAPHLVRIGLGGEQRHRLTSAHTPGVHPDWGTGR